MAFADKLITWYEQHQRDLPWRRSKDPYVIWLSEIILQQTRVDQGMSYFHKFLERHPNIDSLAAASEQEVLKLWQGLGYYSRARNLHFTAKYISEELGGRFPSEHGEIIKLKGVGEYTAAAIASFAYDQPHAVVDGNVYRVLARVFGIFEAIDSTSGKKQFKSLADELLEHKRPAIYNQAIMEFGAIHCTQHHPACEDCPFRLECVAFEQNAINQLPFKEKKLKQRNRYFNYLVLNEDDSVYLNERKGKDIWQGLFDFPLVETSKETLNFKQLLAANEKFEALDLKLISRSKSFKHLLSHQRIHATFWELSGSKTKEMEEDYLKIKTSDMNNYPVPKLIENYLKTKV